MFDLAEIEDRIDKHEKLLKAIQHKMKEMRNSFNEIYTELETKDDYYYAIHPNEKTELNEKIRQRMSVYDLLRETAETIRTQTYADMRTVFDELHKNHYYES
jgi:archaellum component FlaC